jgi:S-adenosylmethionine:tRNA ribosyltransferase-isomerase
MDARAALEPRGAVGGALSTGEVPRRDVRLLVIDPLPASEVPAGRPRVALAPFAALPELLAPGDLVIVNDAATLPASLAARTMRGAAIELRLRGPLDGTRADAVVLGVGDHRDRTEDRPPPPRLAADEPVALVPWHDRGGAPAAFARVVAVSPLSPRAITVELAGDADDAWRTVYRLGRPVQYAHRDGALPLWAVQTSYAGTPFAAEMPSAGRPLTWELLLRLRRRGVVLASLTHAAGLSSTGDAAIDAALPLPERYLLPAATVDAIARARRRGGRVIAIGTTVMRALESAAQGSRAGEPVAGRGIATLVLDASRPPRVVDGLVSGIHAPGDSHHRVLEAMCDVSVLADAGALAVRAELHGHELGDASLVLPGALRGSWPIDAKAALRSMP